MYINVNQCHLVDTVKKARRVKPLNSDNSTYLQDDNRTDAYVVSMLVNAHLDLYVQNLLQETSIELSAKIQGGLVCYKNIA